ncbi:MAG TPA: rod shape-determining protein MreC [Gaiellaceae bacterium]|nr:rod shape-determining protein MreC [Gaiellaceae bacterium]
MPRNRTVRFAVLGSSVQRAATSGYPSNRSSAVKRRIVVGGLVLLSFVLITLSFRSTALDGVQGRAAGALRPFEVGADRVARPFRDAFGWGQGLVDAKSENAKLKAENERLLRQLVRTQSAVAENAYLKRQLDYRAAPTEANFDRVNTEVLTNPQSELDQSITIAAGSRDGVAVGDVVRTPRGLVGVVDRVSPSVARVTLLTDSTSNVNAADVAHPTSVGIVRRGSGGDTLILDHVQKQNFVGVGDMVITAGSLGPGALPSMFPRGIPIGTVMNESDNDINPFHSIQLQPFVDFSSIQSVTVLVPKR